MSPNFIRIADRFEIREKPDQSHLIGQGGMGTVYRGIDTKTQEPVAVKVLKMDKVSDKDMVSRFIREGEALRQLKHPNIVKMLAATEQDGMNYLVMEYVDGGSLRQLLDKSPRLDVQRTLQIALDLSDALTRAHRLNILHRDIKPDNVLLAQDGTPRLTDFGMARIGGAPHITQDGTVLGTLSYLSPEAFNGSDVDERSDIWAFGVLLYEMLAGQRPFKHDDIGALITAILSQPFKRLEDIRSDIPTALVDLIDRMLTKDLQARISSVRLVGAELEAILRGDNMAGLTTPTPTPTSFGTSTMEAIAAVRPSSSSSRQTVPVKIANNLPTPPTPFIGRERELQELNKILTTPSSHLLSLVGTGGVGKTRLALEQARQQAQQFKDGVFYVALDRVANEAQFVVALAEAINFSFGAKREPKQELFDYLREKQMLIVLDNFESAMGAVNLVTDLLQAAPQLKFIATSRERLRLRSEQVFEVSGLSIPPATERDLQALLNYPVVQLFQHSAQRVQPDFYVVADNVALVCQIVRAVEGLPLGIELAAAWLESLSLEEIVREIGQSIDFLETDMRDVPERQRSIRAVFAYSWNLMTADEQQTFSRLTVFQGGFERDAAEKVAGASLRILTNLINKSLIQRDAKGRYSVPKLLRQYALEQMDSAKQGQIAQAHAHYYADWIHQLAPMFNTAKELAILDMIEVEADNLKGAWQNLIERRDWQLLEKAGRPLVQYKIARSLYEEGLQGLGAVLEVLEKEREQFPHHYWWVLTLYHFMGSRIGNYQPVLPAMTAAIDFFHATGAKIEQAVALNVLSYAQMMLGNVRDARELAAQALELVGDFSDVGAWYAAMGNYGYAEYLLGNYGEARSIYESILHTAERMPHSPTTLALSKNNLGEIVREMGDFKSARQLFQAAYDEFKAQHNRRGMAFALNNLAGIIFYSGDYEKANKMYQRAYDLHREIGDRSGMGHSLSALGNASTVQGDWHKAREYYEQAMNIRRSIQDKRGIADSLMDLGLNAMNTEEYSRALTLHNEAIFAMNEIGYMEGMGNAYATRAFIHLIQQAPQQAEPDVQEALRIGEALGNPFIKLQAVASLGELELQYGRLESAEKHLQQALSMAEMSEIPNFALLVMCGLAEVYIARQDYQRALELVSIVLLYPRGFISVINSRALSLLEHLRQFIPEGQIEQMIEQSKSVSLTSFISKVRQWIGS